MEESVKFLIGFIAGAVVALAGIYTGMRMDRR